MQTVKTNKLTETIYHIKARLVLFRAAIKSFQNFRMRENFRAADFSLLFSLRCLYARFERLKHNCQPLSYLKYLYFMPHLEKAD